MVDQIRSRPARVSALTVAGIVFGLVVVLAIGSSIVIPLLLEQPFDSVEDLDPAKIQSLRVFILNRTELDGGEDLGPYFAASEDYSLLLAPLRGLPEVDQYPDARGPWLGEYRIRTQSGRKGTIKLYWVKTPLDPPSAPARLRFQIGPHKYEGGTAEALIAAAQEGSKRGRAVSR